MNISGVLVTAAPGKTERVCKALEAMEGVEVRHTLGDGRMVVVLERESTHDEVKTVRGMYGIEGVISAVMTYHYFEEETADPEGDTPGTGAAAPFRKGLTKSALINNRGESEHGSV